MPDTNIQRKTKFKNYIIDLCRDIFKTDKENYVNSQIKFYALYYAEP